MRRMILLLVLGTSIAALPALAEGRRLEACLIRVVDGDTLRTDLDLGADVELKNQALRVLGIDAPELHGPEREKGEAAKAAAGRFLAGKKLEVELHGKDKYGRWLADVFADGENLALWMLRQGFARPYQMGRRGKP